jgi:hypothetical protein
MPVTHPNADSGERMKKSEYIQKPQNQANDDDGVQDRLDASCHGNETIHQPQEDTNDDQGDQNLNERHTFHLSVFAARLYFYRKFVHALPGAMINATQRKGTNRSGRCTCCSISSALGLVVGNQAEGRGLANTTVLFRKVMLNPRCDSRLFTCIHGRSIWAGFIFYARRRDSFCISTLDE